MAELGNSIANRILENRVGDQVKPVPGSTRPQREVWITLKYKDKAFVNKDIFKGKEVEDNEGWIVNKLRRRARIMKHKTEKCSDKEKSTLEKKDVDTCFEEDEPSLLESVLRASTLTSNSKEASPSCSALSLKKRRVLNTEVVLFGGSLGKHHVASVQLDSDQVIASLYWVIYVVDFHCYYRLDRDREKIINDVSLSEA